MKEILKIGQTMMIVTPTIHLDPSEITTSSKLNRSISPITKPVVSFDYEINLNTRKIKYLKEIETDLEDALHSPEDPTTFSTDHFSNPFDELSGYISDARKAYLQEETCTIIQKLEVDDIVRKIYSNGSIELIHPDGLIEHCNGNQSMSCGKTFLRGMLYGEGAKYDPFALLRAPRYEEGFFHADKLHGDGFRINMDQSIEIGEFCRGELHGEGLTIVPNLLCYMGIYKKGKLVDQGTGKMSPFLSEIYQKYQESNKKSPFNQLRELSLNRFRLPMNTLDACSIPGKCPKKGVLERMRTCFSKTFCCYCK